MALNRQSPSNASPNMLNLVKYLVTNLVEKPESINVQESIDPTGIHLITITVDPSDMGKIIGKGGKIINSIRELAKVKAIKLGLRVKVMLIDPLQTDPSFPSAPPAEPSEIE